MILASFMLIFRRIELCNILCILYITRTVANMFHHFFLPLLKEGLDLTFIVINSVDLEHDASKAKAVGPIPV